MSKQINAPAIVHGSNKESQMKWFQETANNVKTKYNSVQNGKGSRTRTVLTEAGRANWDAIFSKKESK